MWVIWYEDGKKLIKLENIQTFILSGRPRKDEYSRLKNAQKCKLRRKKLEAKSIEFLAMEKKRKRKQRSEMGCQKKKKGANDQGVTNVETVAVVHVHEVAGESSTSSPGSAFLCSQSIHQSLSRTDLHLCTKDPQQKDWNYSKVSTQIQT